MAVNQSKMKCNNPRRTPDGPKKFGVKACEGGKEKTTTIDLNSCRIPSTG